MTTGAAASASGAHRQNGGEARLRSFNRFELKYVGDRQRVRALRDELGRRLDGDVHASGGSYPVWSRYYDTRELRFYWEKVDGVRVRRKLRIRHYGAPARLEADTPVWVEVKQRVNRATQKRRTRLPYADALALCSGKEPRSHDPQDRPVIEEVLGMVARLELRPVTVVGYVREPFIGRDEDGGLRVTIDSRVRGRDRDLDLAQESENRLIVRPDLCVVEVKVHERAPYWLTDRIARHDFRLVRMSKYCQSVEAFGTAPRSRFHVHEDSEASG